MAVNTAALKTFAPAMRRQLLEAVGRKLDLLLNSQTPDTLSTYAKQIAELRDEQEKSREQLLERVAYTWFNRLCALRYPDTGSRAPEPRRLGHLSLEGGGAGLDRASAATGILRWYAVGHRLAYHVAT